MGTQNKPAKVKFSFVQGRQKDYNYVELRIYYGGGVTSYITTQISVPKSAWDTDGQCVVDKYPNAKR